MAVRMEAVAGVQLLGVSFFADCGPAVSGCCNGGNGSSGGGGGWNSGAGGTDEGDGAPAGGLREGTGHGVFSPQLRVFKVMCFLLELEAPGQRTLICAAEEAAEF